MIDYIETHEIVTPFTISKMGTSGLRLKQEIYNQPLFLEQFSQGIALYFKDITDREKIAENNKTLIIGGDPRKGNKDRIRTIAGILVANGFSVVIAEKGLASTPAMSHCIRKLKAAGGIILTASHNPYTDVGIKVNIETGAPALEETVNKIHALQNSVTTYMIANFDRSVEIKKIEYIDIIKQYSDLLDEIFNFTDMKQKIQGKSIKCALDSMNGAAGPFAREVFINRLGINCMMLREEPREDLGGIDEKGEPLHPEPDFDYVKDLIALSSSGEYDITAAWDSDVDRRLDGGKGFFVESADEFALFAKYSELINVEKLFSDTIYFCRSTVTADAIDKMEPFLNKKFSPKKVATVETPTGFKWIAELGNWGVEESNGVGNPYLREKDGIFATVFLLKIILHTGKTPKELMEDIWSEFGRVYFTRGEVSGSSDDEKNKLTTIIANAGACAGRKFGTLVLESAQSWDYNHPLTHKIADKNAAYVLNFSDGNTIKARFSGTGSGGYTMRVYCSKYDQKFNIAKSKITQPMKDAFDDFLKQNGFDGKSKKYTDANQPELYSN